MRYHGNAYLFIKVNIIWNNSHVAMETSLLFDDLLYHITDPGRKDQQRNLMGVQLVKQPGAAISVLNPR